MVYVLILMSASVAAASGPNNIKFRDEITGGNYEFIKNLLSYTENLDDASRAILDTGRSAVLDSISCGGSFKERSDEQLDIFTDSGVSSDSLELTPQAVFISDLLSHNIEKRRSAYASLIYDLEKHENIREEIFQAVGFLIKAGFNDRFLATFLIYQKAWPEAFTQFLKDQVEQGSRAHPGFIHDLLVASGNYQDPKVAKIFGFQKGSLFGLADYFIPLVKLWAVSDLQGGEERLKRGVL